MRLRNLHRSIVRWVLAGALSLLFALIPPAVAVRAQTPTSTPVAPGSGGVTFGTVRVTAGNGLPRNSGQENQPPVWITIDAKGTSAVVTVGNATRVPLDFNGTVIISLAPSADAAGTAVSAGAAVIQGNQVVWSGFSLAAGQIVPGILVLAGNGQPGSSPASTAAIAGVAIEAKDTQSGTVVSEQAAGGGPTLAILAAAPTPAAAQAGTSRSLIPGGAAGAVVPLSRDDARRYASLTLALLLLVLVLVALGTGLVWHAGQTLQRVSLATTRPAGEPGHSAGGTILGQSTAETVDSPPAGSSLITSGWWLELRDGTEPGRRWQLASGELGIGRNPRSEVVIADPRVSDRHARLLRQSDGSYQLVDEGSTNGTDVNGQRITVPVQLHENDVLRFGSTSFLVRYEGSR
jgi:hypothetical protein